MPQFFMTGDGHRHPPFAWTMACTNLRLRFQTLMSQQQLCAHVEQHQDAVTDNSVPVLLQPLFLQGRVFGWELEIYRHLQPVMEQCMTLAEEVDAGRRTPADLLRDVVALDRDVIRIHGLLWQIGNPTGLSGAMAQHEQYRQYYQGLSKGQPRNRATETQYQQFLLNYHRTTMALRTEVNQFIGNNIQKVVDRFPTCTHIITCGDAHITHNPLAQYVQLPGGAAGVVDASNM
jgi:hypothetical protein